jgi:hypothetical protein
MPCAFRRSGFSRDLLRMHKYFAAKSAPAENNRVIALIRFNMLATIGVQPLNNVLFDVNQPVAKKIQNGLLLHLRH